MNEQTYPRVSPQTVRPNPARPAVWLAVLFLLAVPVLAQQDPRRGDEPDQTPGFGEVVDVRVINLEVVVTEDGERVSGLGPGDFQLLVDGEEAPIEFFSEVRNGWAVAGEEASVPASGGTYAVPALEPGESVGTRYLVFVDDYFAVPSYRNRVLAELAEQLPLMSAEDRMAIVAYDGSEVEMLSSWTRSLAELGTALERATQRRAYGLQRRSEERQFDASQRFRTRGTRGARFASTAYLGARGFATLDGLERQRAYELASQVEQVADAATSALRAFARPPGRKVMLLLSGGWPSSISNHVAGTFEPVFDDGFLDGWRPFESLTETANRLGYTLYPVDLGGLESSGFGSAEYGTVFESAAAAGKSYEREYLEEDTLFELAAATGGRAFVDGARNSALEGAVEDTRSYYWLGFSPAWQENDEQHRLEVKVERKGAKVRSRDGFSDLSKGSELTMLVESAQLFDLPLPGEKALGVSFGEAAGDGFKKVVVPVRLEIPLDYVTLLAGGEALGAELELRIAATDDDGDRAEVAVLPVTVSATEPAAAGQIAVLETSLKLRRQPHRLLISLYDPPSGRLLSRRVAVSL